MKKSPLSEFFLIFKPGSHKSQNGNALGTDPIALRRLPIVPTEPKPSSRLPIFVSIVVCAMGVILFVNTREVRHQNNVLLEEVKKNKELIEQTQKERDELKKSLDKTNAEMVSLQTEIKKSEETAGSATEEKTYLEEMLINKSKEIEQLKNQAPAADQRPADASAAGGSADSIENRLAQKETQLKRLVEQNRILSQKLEKLYKTTNEKISEINVAKITLEETIVSAKKAIDNEWNLVDLGSISAGSNGAAKANRTDTRKFPKKEGKVLAVNEAHGFVIVDMGRVDGIKNDTILSLNQNGQTIGKLKVLEIRDVMTACNILDLNSGRKIQLSDPVYIQK